MELCSFRWILLYHILETNVENIFQLIQRIENYLRTFSFVPLSHIIPNYFSAVANVELSFRIPEFQFENENISYWKWNNLFHMHGKKYNLNFQYLVNVHGMSIFLLLENLELKVSFPAEIRYIFGSKSLTVSRKQMMVWNPTELFKFKQISTSTIKNISMK